MSNYEVIKLVHTAIGGLALVAFWSAAIARKGGSVHRVAGRVYLLTLSCVMLSTLPFIVLAFSSGQFAQVVLLTLFAFNLNDGRLAHLGEFNPREA